MRDRGYPVEDFDERASIISVDHPVVVERYRRAHAVTVANAGGDATTESLRRAMQDYRALFVELVEDATTDTDAATTAAVTVLAPPLAPLGSPGRAVVGGQTSRSAG